MATKKKTFSVTFNVEVHTSIEIQADSFEEALTKARTYEVKDIVDFDTDFIDGQVKVTTIWNNEGL